jgi:uncharacterized RDD family membrane protein YckC
MITTRLRNQLLAVALAGAALAGTAQAMYASADGRADAKADGGAHARALAAQDVTLPPAPEPAGQPAPAAQAPATPATPAIPSTPATPRTPVTPPTPAAPEARAPRPARPASATPARPDASAPGQPDTVDTPDGSDVRQYPDHWRGRTAFRFGSDYFLMPDDTAGDVIVIAGTATIAGHVDGDVVVVAGSARLASTAVVDGDFVVVGGSADVDGGAAVQGDLVVVMGALKAPPAFRPGGEQTVVGPLFVGDGLRAAVPWVTTGLLWGRPIVPSLPWVWGFVAVFFATYLILNLLFDRPIRACAEKLAERPLSAFMAGLLVLVLLGPISVLLAASVVGIALIPFLLCAVFVAGLLGKVSVLRMLGATIVRQDEADNRLLSARSFVLGFVAVTLLYMVPVLGMIGWATLGVFGLGSSAMAFAAGLRRENPRPAVVPRVPPPPQAPPFAQAAASGFAPDATPLTGDTPATIGSPVASDGVPQLPPASASELLCYPRATFLERLGAFVLDVVLVSLTYALLDFDVDGPHRFFLLLFLYRAAFWAWKGTTVGGIILQLRVVRTDGAPLGLSDAVVRGLSSVFSIVVLGLGCLWILRDPERQAWHDRIAGTYVVKVPRNYPLA